MLAGTEDKRQLAMALMAKAKGERPSRTRHRRPKETLDLLNWAIRHRRLLKPGAYFSLDDHRYLIDLYRDNSQESSYMKAGQVGVSELLISFGLHANDQRAADVLYLMPTSDDVSDFSRSRFGPALEASDYLNGLVVGAGRERRGSDKITLKRIRDNFLYLRGATVDKTGNARQLKSIPVDILIGDEIDEMDPRAMPIARKRLGHSPIKEVRQASTPTYHGVGIHAVWTDSDQREWFVPCPHCGYRQRLTIQQVVVEWDELERPVAWHGMNEDRAYVVCKRCGQELDRLAQGEWIPAHPGRPITGFHPTKLMAGHTALIDVVRNLQTVDETKRKEAYNQDLGLPYTPRGGRLLDEHIDALKREYGHGPIPSIRPYAGIDVGKMLHIVIRAPMDGEGARRQLWAGEVYTFREADHKLREYNVSFFVIDGLPETRKSRELQAAFPDGVGWLAFYNGAEQAEQPVSWNRKEGVVNVDRTRILDEMYAGFYDGKTNVIPEHIKSVADYYSHLKAPVRVLEKRAHGKEVAIYIEDAPDHYAHAEAYCLTASKHPPLQTTAPPKVIRRDQFDL
ncbi:MAG: phage terminase large subunit family protein [Anaerolineales bacterium]|nr:phage terminase large subunit family protein [Anaerolineales bacterium]